MKKIDVSQIAKLANLTITAKQSRKFLSELSQTLDYISHLNEIDTSQIKPTHQVSGKVNEFREDIVTASLPITEVLKNAKNTYKNYFVVPNFRQ